MYEEGLTNAVPAMILHSIPLFASLLFNIGKIFLSEVLISALLLFVDLTSSLKLRILSSILSGKFLLFFNDFSNV